MEPNTPVSLGLENFLKYLRDAQMEYHVALDVEREADNKSNDFNHAIEFGGYDPRRAATLLKKYRAVRQDRRKAKQLIETTGLIEGWCSQNQAVIRSLESLLGEIRKSEKKAQNRVYVPRTDFMEDEK